MVNVSEIVYNNNVNGKANLMRRQNILRPIGIQQQMQTAPAATEEVYTIPIETFQKSMEMNSDYSAGLEAGRNAARAAYEPILTQKFGAPTVDGYVLNQSQLDEALGIISDKYAENRITVIDAAAKDALVADVRANGGVSTRSVAAAQAPAPAAPTVSPEVTAAREVIAKQGTISRTDLRAILVSDSHVKGAYEQVADNASKLAELNAKIDEVITTHFGADENIALTSQQAVDKLSAMQTEVRQFETSTLGGIVKVKPFQDLSLVEERTAILEKAGLPSYAQYTAAQTTLRTAAQAAGNTAGVNAANQALFNGATLETGKTTTTTVDKGAELAGSTFTRDAMVAEASKVKSTATGNPEIAPAVAGQIVDDVIKSKLGDAPDFGAVTKQKSIEILGAVNLELGAQGYTQITNSQASSVFPWMNSVGGDDKPVSLQNTNAKEEQAVQTNFLQGFLEALQNGDLMGFIGNLISGWFGGAEGEKATATAVTAEQQVQDALTEAGITVAADREAAITKSVELMDSGTKDQLAARTLAQGVDAQRGVVLNAALKGKDQLAAALKIPQPAPANISLQGQKIKLYDKSGVAIQKGGADVEITLGANAQFSTQGLTGFEVDWHDSMVSVNVHISNQPYEVILEEAKQQAILDSAREMWQNPNMGVEVIEQGSQKLVAVQAEVQGAEQTIGFYDLNSGELYQGADSKNMTQFQAKDANGNSLTMGAHPQADKFGTLTAEYLLTSEGQAELTNFLVQVYDQHDSDDLQMSAYKQDILSQTDLNGIHLGEHVMAHNITKYLQRAQKEGADLSQIKLTPELMAGLKGEQFAEDYFVTSLDTKDMNVMEAMFASPQMKDFEMDQFVGVKSGTAHGLRADQRTFGGLGNSPYNLLVVKSASGDYAAQAQLQEVREAQAKAMASIQNATLGDLAKAIKKVETGESLSAVEATLYTRAYTTIQHNFGGDFNLIQSELYQMAENIDAKDGKVEEAERLLIVRPNGKDNDGRILTDIIAQNGITDGFKVNATSMAGMQTHSSLQTGVFYNRDLFQNRGWNGRQATNPWNSVVDNLNIEEKEAILREYIRHNAKQGLKKGLLGGAVDIVTGTAGAYSNKIPPLTLPGGVVIDSASIGKYTSAQLGQYFDQLVVSNNPNRDLQEFTRDHLEEEYYRKATGVAGLQTEAKRSAESGFVLKSDNNRLFEREKMSAREYKKPLEERTLKGNIEVEEVVDRDLEQIKQEVAQSEENNELEADAVKNIQGVQAPSSTLEAIPGEPGSGLTSTLASELQDVVDVLNRPGAYSEKADDKNAFDREYNEFIQAINDKIDTMPNSQEKIALAEYRGKVAGELGKVKAAQQGM